MGSELQLENVRDLAGFDHDDVRNLIVPVRLDNNTLVRERSAKRRIKGSLQAPLVDDMTFLVFLSDGIPYSAELVQFDV